MQSTILPQSLDLCQLLAEAHTPQTRAAGGEPRGHLCTGAHQPLAEISGSRDKEDNKRFGKGNDLATHRIHN